MLTKIILWLTAIALGVYGLACFLDAGLASGYAGFELLNDDARSEMIAMYGGVQMAISAFCLLAIFKPEHQHSALCLLVFLFAGLAGGRAFGLLQGATTAGSYSYGALCYEVLSLALAIAALLSFRRS